jgi:hypothetical protein
MVNRRKFVATLGGCAVLPVVPRALDRSESKPAEAAAQVGACHAWGEFPYGGSPGAGGECRRRKSLGGARNGAGEILASSPHGGRPVETNG